MLPKQKLQQRSLKSENELDTGCSYNPVCMDRVVLQRRIYRKEDLQHTEEEQDKRDPIRSCGLQDSPSKWEGEATSTGNNI